MTVLVGFLIGLTLLCGFYPLFLVWKSKKKRMEKFHREARKPSTHRTQPKPTKTSVEFGELITQKSDDSLVQVVAKRNAAPTPKVIHVKKVEPEQIHSFTSAYYSTTSFNDPPKPTSVPKPAITKTKREEHRSYNKTERYSNYETSRSEEDDRKAIGFESSFSSPSLDLSNFFSDSSSSSSFGGGDSSGGGSSDSW